jgi:hypothetical protein
LEVVVTRLCRQLEREWKSSLLEFASEFVRVIGGIDSRTVSGGIGRDVGVVVEFEERVSCAK